MEELTNNINDSLKKLEINDNVVVVKRKKGRPRKDITLQEVPKVPEEKKKRGRKKKEVVIEEVKQKKKRGRKAAVKYFSSSIRRKIPLTTVLQDNNNYILHLDVKDNDTEQNDNVINLESLENKDVISNVFEKLKTENDKHLSEIQKEYEELLDKEESILNEIVDNEDNKDNKDNKDNEDNEDNEDNLSELYEKRIEYREHQDNMIVNKLENYHKENNIFDKICSVEFSGNKNEINLETDNKTDDIQINNRKKGYFELMRSFVCSDKWLYNTDVCCWWCCHTFDTVPIGNPNRYDRKVEKFRVKGVFCSFSCLIAYRNDSCKKYSLTNYLVKFMYSKLTGTFLLDSNLTPSPPRSCLKMFGGDLTIEEFRNAFRENKIYKMIEYPMFVSKDYIEEVDIQNVKRVNHNVFVEMQSKTRNLDDKRVEDARNRLSQIEKSTITIGNTIDKFIKFT
jgi:hypothetical protein